jgi:hypothetical protein
LIAVPEVGKCNGTSSAIDKDGEVTIDI